MAPSPTLHDFLNAFPRWGRLSRARARVFEDLGLHEEALHLGMVEYRGGSYTLTGRGARYCLAVACDKLDEALAEAIAGLVIRVVRAFRAAADFVRWAQ
jgi:hypothetical protein